MCCHCVEMIKDIPIISSALSLSFYVNNWWSDVTFNMSEKKEHMSEKRKTRYSEWVLVVSILFWFLLYMFARWRLVCKDRWSDLEKVRWHLRQRKGRCPVCLRKCRVSSSERAKRHEHPVHEQAYGFSPMEMKNKKYN